MQTFETLLLALSVCLNGFLFLKLRELSKKPTPTYDVQDLLSDLMRGNALVKVSRVAPEDVFLRSAKGR